MLRFHESIGHFVEYCRLSASFIWGTSCWMVTLWGGWWVHNHHRHSAQVATDIGPRTASRCSLPRCQWPLWGGGENQWSKHAPVTMHQFSSAVVNQTPFPVLGLIEHAWRQVVPLKSCSVMLVSLQQSFPSEIMQDPVKLSAWSNFYHILSPVCPTRMQYFESHDVITSTPTTEARSSGNPISMAVPRQSEPGPKIWMLQYIISMFLHITVPILFVLNAKMWQCQVWNTHSQFMT